MSVRQRVEARLQRSVLGGDPVAAPVLSLRIDARAQRPIESFESSVGAVAHLRGPDVVYKRARPANPTPNAPLLMRLVKHPFRLDPGRRFRVRFLDEPAGARPKAVFGHVLADAGAYRADFSLRNPLRLYPHRPLERPRPFQRAREDRAQVALDEAAAEVNDE